MKNFGNFDVQLDVGFENNQILKIAPAAIKFGFRIKMDSDFDIAPLPNGYGTSNVEGAIGARWVYKF